MTTESTDKVTSTETLASKIYLKTDGAFAKAILVIGLSGGLIAMFYGYFMWGWGEEAFAFLAIPFTIYFSIALLLTIFRLVYPIRDGTKKKLRKDVTTLADEALQVRYKRKRILITSLAFVTICFVTVSVFLTIVTMTPIYLVWLIPAVFPAIFLVIEFKQLKQVNEEKEKRR